MRRTYLAFSLVWMLSAASPLVSPAEARKPALPSQVISVPIVEQEEDYSCGPAALLSILRYFGISDGPEERLYRLLDTSQKEGTLPESLAAGARHFGLTANIEQMMTIERLRTVVGSGKLVIIELQAWRDPERQSLPWRDVWDDGHYVVLIGLDSDFAYFMDPSTGGAYTYLPLNELVQRWHDINQMRKDPREYKDIQLGVVIGGPPRHPPPPLVTRRLLRLD